MTNLATIQYYESKKTSELFTLIKNSGGQVVLENAEGKQTKISESTFKRWYTKVDTPALAAEVINAMATEVTVTAELPPNKVDEDGREYIDFGKVEEAPIKAKGGRGKRNNFVTMGSETGRIPAKSENKPAEPKSEESKSEQKKQNRVRMFDVIFNKAKEIGAVIQVNTSNTAIKFEGKNIAEIVGNNIYSAYSALPSELFHNKNVSFTPEAWKWTLSVKVAISEDNLDLIGKLLEAGKKYRMESIKTTKK